MLVLQLSISERVAFEGMAANVGVLLKAGFRIPSAQPLTQILKTILWVYGITFWTGRHQMLTGKEQMPIAHTSSHALSNTYVSCRISRLIICLIDTLLLEFFVSIRGFGSRL